MPLILEGLVSTLAADGGPHLAPMGPHVPAAEFDRFTLRPFPSSQTFRNLQAHGEGVHHLAIHVESLDAAIDSMRDAGLELLQLGRGFGVDGDGGFAYFDTEHQLGVVLEAIELPTHRREPELVIP